MPSPNPHSSVEFNNKNVCFGEKDPQLLINFKNINGQNQEGFYVENSRNLVHDTITQKKNLTYDEQKPRIKTAVTRPNRRIG